MWPLRPRVGADEDSLLSKHSCSFLFFFLERVNEAAAVIKIKGAEPLVLLLIVSVQSQM